jgi:hypothetical protein
LAHTHFLVRFHEQELFSPSDADSLFNAFTRQVCLSLFLLKEKVTKKFKENPIAPRVFPCLRTAKAFRDRHTSVENRKLTGDDKTIPLFRFVCYNSAR